MIGFKGNVMGETLAKDRRILNRDGGGPPFVLKWFFRLGEMQSALRNMHTDVANLPWPVSSFWARPALGLGEVATFHTCKTKLRLQHSLLVLHPVAPLPRSQGVESKVPPRPRPVLVIRCAYVEGASI